jgi:hypothetical protein
MKKLLLLSMLSCAIFSSCEDDATDEFENGNGNVAVKLIETISVNSQQDSSDNAMLTINYNADNVVTSATDGEDSIAMVYGANGDLTNITGSGSDPLNIEEAYESPYDAFETGEVLSYDSNGNPEEIMFLEERYDWDTDSYIVSEYTAEVSYDNAPNPYFYTLDAAGLIDVLDNIQLNFSADIAAPELVQARLLLPVNNVSGITYKDEDGNVLFQIVANYVYDADNYPTSASVTSTDLDTNEVYTYSGTYTYK